MDKKLNTNEIIEKINAIFNGIENADKKRLNLYWWGGTYMAKTYLFYELVKVGNYKPKNPLEDGNGTLAEMSFIDFCVKPAKKLGAKPHLIEFELIDYNTCFRDLDFFQTSECPFEIETYEEINICLEEGLESRIVTTLKNADFIEGMKALCKFVDDYLEALRIEHKGPKYERHTNY